MTNITGKKQKSFFSADGYIINSVKDQFLDEETSEETLYELLMGVLNEVNLVRDFSSDKCKINITNEKLVNFTVKKMEFELAMMTISVIKRLKFEASIDIKTCRIDSKEFSVWLQEHGNLEVEHEKIKQMHKIC